MGNLNSCNIDSCNNIVEAELNKYKIKLETDKYMDEYRQKMKNKGIDIDKLKKQWEIVYENMATAKKVDHSHDVFKRAMANRGDNQIAGFKQFGRRKSKNRKQRSKKRSKKHRRSRKRR